MSDKGLVNLRVFAHILFTLLVGSFLLSVSGLAEEGQDGHSYEKHKQGSFPSTGAPGPSHAAGPEPCSVFAWYS